MRNKLVLVVGILLTAGCLSHSGDNPNGVSREGMSFDNRGVSQPHPQSTDNNELHPQQR